MDKKFKILRISHIFTPALMGQVVKGIPDFDRMPFQDQISKISELKVDNCMALSKELRSIGHQVDDVYFDLEIPQKKWAKENDVEWQSDLDNWQEKILLKQIEKMRPDILFFQKYTIFSGKTLHNLKTIFPFIQKIVFHTAYLGNLGDVGYADLLLVGTPSLLNRFKREGFEPKLFYHYFDTEILDHFHLTENGKKFALTFLGSSGFGGGYLHADRFTTLRHVMENTPMEAWVSEPKNTDIRKNLQGNARSVIKKAINVLPRFFVQKISVSKGFFKKYGLVANEVMREREFHQAGHKLPLTNLGSLFNGRCHNAVMGLEYYKKMAESKISFTKSCNNIFDGAASKGGDIGALRLFEATGLGSCLVADSGTNMRDLFDEDKEVITYSSKEEAVEKINYLLSNEKFRQAVAKAGQARTLRDHTAANRAVQFDLLLSEKS